MDDVFTRLQRLDDLDAAVMQQESGGRADARSPKGALGPMQVMPATASNPGLGVPAFDPRDPVASAEGGRQYFAALLGRYHGDVPKALAAYNAGMGRVDKGGTLPTETQNYVKSIMGRTGAAQPAAAPVAEASPDVFSRLAALDEQQPVAPAKEEPQGFAAILPDAMEFGSNVAHAVVHPVDTINAIGQMGAGLIQKATGFKPFLNSDLSVMTPEQRAAAQGSLAYGDAAVKHYKDAYGSIDAIKHTALTHPVQMLGDVASVLIPAGEGIEAGANLAGLSRVAKAGSVVSRVGNAVDPIQIATGIGSRVAQPILNNTAEHIANVNLQVPKNMRRREMGRDAGVPQAEAVLNTGRGTNPFTRFSQGGLDNAEKVGNKQQAIKSALRNADEAAGNLYDPSPIDSAMESQRPYWSNDPTEGVANEALIDRKRQNFRNNDKYAQDKVVQVPVQKTVQTPHPFAVDAQGNPIMQSGTQTVMEPQVIGREFKPVGANQLEAAKGPVYTRQAENYGPGRDAVGSAVDKAAASAADNILDTNIPGYDRASRTHQQAEVARKALAEAILARQTKRKGLFAESMAFAAPILAGEGHPIAGGAMGAIAAYNTIAKHPWLASPTASALWGAGHMATPAGVTNMLTPATQLSQAVKNVGKRTVTAQEVVPLYQAYLDATRNKDDK